MFLQAEVGRKYVMTIDPSFYFTNEHIYGLIIMPWLFTLPIANPHTCKWRRFCEIPAPLITVDIVLCPIQYLHPFAHKDRWLVKCPDKPKRYSFTLRRLLCLLVPTCTSDTSSCVIWFWTWLSLNPGILYLLPARKCGLVLFATRSLIGSFHVKCYYLIY